MILKNFYKNDIELELNNFTFITSSNIELLNNLFTYNGKYFSNYKYATEEIDYLYHDDYPTIVHNEQVLSRDYFKAFFINSCESLDEYLTLSKDGILYEYNMSILENVNIQNEIEQINILYSEINHMIRNEYPNDYILGTEDIELNSEYFLKKNFKQSIKCKYNYKDKLIQFINLVYDTYLLRPKKHLIYLHNIDGILNTNDFNEIYNFIKEKLKGLDIYVIISSKDSNYIFIDEYEFVNVLTETNIEKYISEMDLIKQVNNNIEKNILISPLELRDYLMSHGSHIFEDLVTAENNYLIDKSLKNKNSTKKTDIKYDLDFENIIEI